MQDPNERIHQCLAQADLEAAGLSQPEHALMELVRKVTVEAYKTTDADIEHLRGHGWTDPQIAEAVYITAMFAFFNRVADAFGLEDPRYFDNPPPRGGDRAESETQDRGQA